MAQDVELSLTLSQAGLACTPPSAPRTRGVSSSGSSLFLELAELSSPAVLMVPCWLNRQKLWLNLWTWNHAGNHVPAHRVV